MSKRKLRNSGSTNDVELDSSKSYKYNSSGSLVEATTVADTDIVFSGSKSNLRRIADLERNVSILAAKSLTDDGEGSGTYGAVDYAKKAGQWYTTRTLSLSGDATGSVSVSGAGDMTLSVAVVDDSHNHIIANIDGLQTALDGKSATGHGHPYLPLTGGTITGTTASTSKTTGALIVNGGVGIAGAIFAGGEVTAYASDAALKTNVVAIDGALAKVEAIRGVTYDWNEIGQGLGLGTEPQVGVIAQEIEAVLPQLVVDSAHEGYKTVKYDKLTALLIEAVKELSGKVASLEAQLAGK